MHVSSADLTSPAATVDIAANLLTEPNASSLVTIHFSEAVTGFGFVDLTPTGGTLGSFVFPADRRRHLRSELFGKLRLRRHGAGDLDGGLRGVRRETGNE